MKVVVAANDTGAIKEVVFNRGTDTSKQDGLQPISVKNFCVEESTRTRILQMVNYGNRYLIASRLGGRVCVYDLESHSAEDVPDEDKYKLVHTYQIALNEPNDKSIALIPFEAEELVVIAFESGKVVLINMMDDFSKDDVRPIEIQLDEKVPISVFVANPYETGVFAYGGKELDVKIVKLFDDSINVKQNDDNGGFKPECLFSAKNVKNDHLDLRVPIWITGIQFLESESSGSYKLITTTRYGQLRIYNTLEGKRPRHDYQLCEKPVLTVNFANEDHTEVIITDTHTLMGKFSLTNVDSRGFQMHSASAGDIVKPTLKLLGKYLGGNTGATFGTDVVEDEMFAAAGLDRYFRLFDVSTREVLAKIYLGVEASAVLLLDIEDEEVEQQAEEEDKPKKRARKDTTGEDEVDEEELWAQLGEEEATKTTKKVKT
ncbi:Ribosome biogenesis protein nsa1 (NOP7-associated protein 1) [Scheffersomyces spartinae]|uniref:Ribosome biogenesis protein NSA1 n=1 Tax=Scheffersomyces spartinae TaxID=45513 RepID=A0A9P7VD14_9ASCO|nr:Ribosome biogenesis protein nsa1 (NOP7-associated protein 1) [Scheffersomyces spartinae]KAG7195711.1 Ribosome biogenesis protein nsa1 (NOP7-associated protein 1) [Scheffersomyces spartinae]